MFRGFSPVFWFSFLLKNQQFQIGTGQEQETRMKALNNVYCLDVASGKWTEASQTGAGFLIEVKTIERSTLGRGA